MSLEWLENVSPDDWLYRNAALGFFRTKGASMASIPSLGSPLVFVEVVVARFLAGGEARASLNTFAVAGFGIAVVREAAL
jgi:hypothetical protein